MRRVALCGFVRALCVTGLCGSMGQAALCGPFCEENGCGGLVCGALCGDFVQPLCAEGLVW